MGKKSSKHESVVPIKMILNGGVNFAQTPANIADNECRRGHNFIYDPNTDYLVTRPGTDCVTASALANPILNLHYYEKDAAHKYLVGASGGKLYYLDGTSWVEIGSLHDSTTIPSFLTFNSKLIVADGGADLNEWDGTTYAATTTSPDGSALCTINNRIVANADSEKDSVYMTTTEVYNDWNTAGTALGIKCGYGDNMTVNGFGVFGTDLIVSKKGDSEKRLYRIDTSGATPTNWKAEMLSSVNCAQNHKSITAAYNNIFFADSNGFKAVKGVESYGDLQVDPVGKKINSVFTSGNNCDFVTYLPAYNAIWTGMGERIFCYTERLNASGSIVPAFTDIAFKWGRCRAICQAGDVVYLAGHNGYLYKLDETLSTDETAPSTTSTYPSILRTKTLMFGSDGILRKLQFYLRPKASGTGYLYCYKDEETPVNMKTVTLTPGGDCLYDATGDLADATGDLYDDGYYAWVETTRNRVRSGQMAFEIYLSSGRVGVEWVQAEIAQVEGGE